MEVENVSRSRFRNKLRSRGFWVRMTVATLWILGAILVVWMWRDSGLPASELPAALAERLQQFGVWQATALYILLYMLRPLLFFPSTIFALASGLLFGPVWGLAYAMIGENLGANFAFRLARFLGRDWFQEALTPKLRAWDARISREGMVGVLVARLINLPFDTVSYLCGLTSVRQSSFAVATFIGALPFLIGCTLFGSAASASTEGSVLFVGLELSRRALMIGSAAFAFGCGLFLAWRLRRTLPADVRC